MTGTREGSETETIDSRRNSSTTNETINTNQESKESKEGTSHDREMTGSGTKTDPRRGTKRELPGDPSTTSTRMLTSPIRNSRVGSIRLRGV